MIVSTNNKFVFPELLEVLDKTVTNLTPVDVLPEHIVRLQAVLKNAEELLSRNPNVHNDGIRQYAPITLVKVVVAATTCGGSPGFYFCIVQCTTQEYQAGEHYELAIEAARDADYEDPMVAYDEHDGNAFLFATCDWESVPRITSPEVEKIPITKRKNGGK